MFCCTLTNRWWHAKLLVIYAFVRLRARVTLSSNGGFKQVVFPTVRHGETAPAEGTDPVNSCAPSSKLVFPGSSFSIKHALRLDFFPCESEGATHDRGWVGGGGGSAIFFLLFSYLPLFHLERPSPPHLDDVEERGGHNNEKMKCVNLLTARHSWGVNGEGWCTHSLLFSRFLFLSLPRFSGGEHVAAMPSEDNQQWFFLVFFFS